jgi:hypothetical protein
MEDSSKTDFSIERFLKEARIEEKYITRYAEFLKKWGLNGEQDLPRFSSVTKLMEYATAIKFDIDLPYASKIAFAAEKWGGKLFLRF